MAAVSELRLRAAHAKSAAAVRQTEAARLVCIRQWRKGLERIGAETVAVVQIAAELGPDGIKKTSVNPRRAHRFISTFLDNNADFN